VVFLQQGRDVGLEGGSGDELHGEAKV
jgi:hypothetical protein